MTGQEGKPESYYFPPQYNNVDNNFCYTFMGLEPGTTKAQLRKCLEDWSKGDNGILDLSRAYRLKRGTGWLIPPGVLHAPGSLCTYEPQWGSDVFGMYQSLVEGREVPWSLCVKDVPEDKKYDLDYIIDQLDWEKNVDTHFKEHNYLEPIVAGQGTGWVDKWIVYGTDRRQAAVQRQGTDGRAGCAVHAQGSGRQRLDHRAGQGHDGQAQPADARHDPVRRGDRGRSVHHVRSGQRGRGDREHRAANRWSACGTLARTSMPRCPASAITEEVQLKGRVNTMSKRTSIGTWAFLFNQKEPIGFEDVVVGLHELKFDGLELGGFGIHPNPDLCRRRATSGRRSATCGNRAGWAAAAWPPTCGPNG